MSNYKEKSDPNWIGYVQEPRYNNEGQLMSWQIKLKKADLKNLEAFATPINEKGEGGNIFIDLKMSKNGKPYGEVWDPNTRASKENLQGKQAKQPAVAESDGVPF